MSSLLYFPLCFHEFCRQKSAVPLHLSLHVSLQTLHTHIFSSSESFPDKVWSKPAAASVRWRLPSSPSFSNTPSTRPCRETHTGLWWREKRCQRVKQTNKQTNKQTHTHSWMSLKYSVKCWVSRWCNCQLLLTFLSFRWLCEAENDLQWFVRAAVSTALLRRSIVIWRA